MSESFSPLSWTGNKSCIIDVLLAVIPPHEVFLEACCGSAELTFRKVRCQKEYINDYNGDITNFFRVVQSNNSLATLIGKLWLHPNSEQMFYENKKYLKSIPNIIDDNSDLANYLLIKKSKGSLKRAVALFTNQLYGFFSTGTSFGKKNVDITKRLYRLIAANNRLRNVVILHRDYKNAIRAVACKGAFIYIDPPYRGTENMYGKSNFNKDEHKILFELVNELNIKFDGECKFLISYNNDPYIVAMANEYGFYTMVVKRKHNMVQAKTPGAEFEELLIANYDMKRQAESNGQILTNEITQLSLFED